MDNLPANHLTEEELEREVNNLTLHNLLDHNSLPEEKKRKHPNYFKDLDEFDLDEYDKIFSQTGDNFDKKFGKNIASKENKGVKPIVKNDMKTKAEKKVLDDEISKLFSEYERKIEEEVDKELKETFRPFDFVENEDIIRAKKVYEKDDLVKKAVEVGMITFEEIVYFIDYYELFALINRKKKETVGTLNQISELYNEIEMEQNNNEEEEEVEGEYSDNEEEVDNKNIHHEDEEFNTARSKVQNSLNNMRHVIMENEEFDYDKMKYDKHLRPDADISQFSNNGNKSPTEKSTLTPNITKSKGNTFSDFKSVRKSTNNIKNKKTTFTTATSIQINCENASNTANTSNTLRNSTNSKSSTANSQRKVDLFNPNDNKIINLSKVRKDRKEILKHNKTSSSKPNLFKYNFNNKENRNSQQEQELKQKILEIFEMPKIMLENNSHMSEPKKNSLKRKIEDAQNFLKNKLK
jgi:hypothetical protein